VRLAIVAGGWHWPLDFFCKIAAQAPGADLFAIAHRNPELPIVREEKREVLNKAVGPLADLDRGGSAGAADHETALLHLQSTRQHLDSCAGGHGHRHFLSDGAEAQRQFALACDDEAAGLDGLEVEAGAGAHELHVGDHLAVAPRHGRLPTERQSPQPERPVAVRGVQLAAGAPQVVFGGA